jgi:hypothetical protein
VKLELDFIVIGAQKCGTTSLFEYMRGHPELYVPPAKEVPYFSHAEYREDWGEYIHRLFAPADPGRRWGTVTPQYMVGGFYRRDANSEGEWGDPRLVPARIRERLPEARLIALLRDPVERARSHYEWALQTGWETRPLDQAVGDLLAPAALASARARPAERTGYVTWGEYGRILDGYFEVFPAEQLLVVYTSELKDAPAAVMRRVFGFLGVTQEYLPANLGAIYRPSAMVPRRFPRLKLESLKARVAANRPARRLWHITPAPARRQIDTRFDRLDYWFDTFNRRYPRNEFPHVQVPRREVATADAGLEQALRSHYESDGRLLGSRLGEVPPWLTAAKPA